jgi:uncharacterized protein YceK
MSNQPKGMPIKTMIVFAKMLVLASLMTSTGCGTYVAYKARNNSETGWVDIPKGPYSGVQTDAMGIMTGVLPFALVDMPLSAIGDTCMLPYYLK